MTEGGSDIMKKSIIAGMMAAITIGATAGGIATFSAAQEDAQLLLPDQGSPHPGEGPQARH